MNNVFSILFLLSTVSISAQGWLQYQVDENMRVQVPEGFKTEDTLGMRLIWYKAQNEYIIIVKDTYDEDLRTVRPEDLNAVYRKFQHGMVSAEDRQLITEKPFMKNGLRWRYFSFKSVWQGMPETQHYVVLLLHGMLYTINYTCWNESTYTINRQKHFYSSIKTKFGLTVSDQLMHKLKK